MAENHSPINCFVWEAKFSYWKCTTTSPIESPSFFATVDVVAALKSISCYLFTILESRDMPDRFKYNGMFPQWAILHLWENCNLKDGSSIAESLNFSFGNYAIFYTRFYIAKELAELLSINLRSLFNSFLKRITNYTPVYKWPKPSITTLSRTPLALMKTNLPVFMWSAHTAPEVGP